MGFGVYCVGFRVQGFGFRVWVWESTSSVRVKLVIKYDKTTGVLIVLVVLSCFKIIITRLDLVVQN